MAYSIRPLGHILRQQGELYVSTQKRSPSRTDILRFLAVEAKAPLPLATQLRQQLAWLIASGQVLAGEKLPPVRVVARHLGINRNTVRAAYQQLEADGLVTLRQGRGSMVLPEETRRSHQQASNVPTFTIGVLVPGLNPFYTPFLQGIEERVRDAPWLLLVCYTHDNPRLARRYLEQLIARQVDGLIVAAGLPEAEVFGRDLPPVVHVDEPEVSGNVILLDSECAGFLATQHLLEHGHRRIGLISGPLIWANVRACYLGYERALRAAGLQAEADCVVQVPTFTLEAGRQAARRLLDLPRPPTALFGAADVLAIGAMRAIEERGQRVPEDVAVVGYNDIDLAALVKPALTTVAAPSYEMGVAAMSMLLDLLAGRPVKQRRVMLPTRLMVRQSCGCAES
ncbi:MAG: GntR family transcriptional regulator [Chloroflexi bacterium]|nr:GntR family transcriptional regulator [Chloroflexota bacterium]